MRLLVTGGSGFLGGYVLDEAARRGHQRLAEDKAFAVDDAVRDLGYSPRPFAEGILAEARALGLADRGEP